MGDDIRLRNLAESTYKNYTRNVRKFFAFCKRPIDELDETDIRRFLKYLINEKKLAPRSVNQHSAAIRFFFAVGLNRYMNYNQIPMMKIPKTLPDVLTREEVSRLISVCTNPKHKALLLLAYGSGLRSGEIEALRTKDIDSKEMRVFVKGGKNKRDHFAVLSQTTLEALRDYWRAYRPSSPEGWLFPGFRNVGHLTRAAIALAFDTCVSRTNITKEVSPHSLRHAFATHLLEDGVELMKIKELLGHYRISSTMVYLHLVNATKGIISPADEMVTQDA
ncbi:MAG: tyrosine-type recombinase/integrase [Firmicutes bacterium]|nr:tyrosine-type recombinase/integrase [Bacillota bacterium]